VDPEIIEECRKYIESSSNSRNIVIQNMKRELKNEILVKNVSTKLAELEPFIDYFYKDMLKIYDKPSDFYNYCGISKSVFSSMNRDDYDPSIETVYKIIFGMKLRLSESLLLLENAGYSITFKTIQQRIVMFCLLKKIYNLNDIDLLMVEFGQPTLFAQE